MLLLQRGIVLEKIELEERLSEDLFNEALENFDKGKIDKGQLDEAAIQSRISRAKADILKWVLDLPESTSICK